MDPAIWVLIGLEWLVETVVDVSTWPSAQDAYEYACSLAASRIRKDGNIRQVRRWPEDDASE